MRSLSLKEVGHGVAASLFFFMAAMSAHAEAYIPDDDAVVLERLRPPGDPATRELGALAEAVRARPDSFEPAAKLIRRHVELAREDGDPRHAGYAEAVLRPWVGRERPSTEALYLSATLKQYRHDFDGALDDLNQVLDQRPDAAEALLSRATLFQVRADFERAGRDCAGLRGLTADLIAEVCSAIVSSLTGNAEAAYGTLLREVETDDGSLPPHLISWAQQALGEIAARRGDAARAEAHYRLAKEIGGGDLFLTSALFDLLFDAGRIEEARALLGTDLRPDLLLLRHAQAAKALDEPGFDNLAGTLETRFAESALRGDQRHLREEARFRLLLEGQAGRALDLALRNWQHQREVADARLVLEAALAAGQAEAARPVLEWARMVRLEDATLAPLLTDIEEAIR
jgi:tetratricopeptide (TPR) repeat protein